MCKISRKNSKWLLRKWQITLGDTFLPHTVDVRNDNSRYVTSCLAYSIPWQLCLHFVRFDAVSHTGGKSQLYASPPFNVGSRLESDFYWDFSIIYDTRKPRKTRKPEWYVCYCWFDNILAISIQCTSVSERQTDGQSGSSIQYCALHSDAL